MHAAPPPRGISVLFLGKPRHSHIAVERGWEGSKPEYKRASVWLLVILEAALHGGDSKVDALV